MRRSPFLLLTLLASAGLLAAVTFAGCDRKPEAPWGQRDSEGRSKAQIYVLVDLSETWLNKPSEGRNLSVLRELGHGLALAGDDLPQPLAIQYRAIGENSLERPPICDVLYRRTLAPVGNRPDYELNTHRKLASYLGEDCPTVVVAGAPEKLTEVSAAVISVANQRARPGDRRYLVIVSDFLEEASVPVSMPQRLDNFRVLMIYRPVPKDMSHPVRMTARVDDWEQIFQERGAEVIAIPDTGLKRSEIGSYISAN